MGVMGMGYADFCRLTPEAFGECAKAWNQVETERQRQHWERMRMLATITVQPHSKKRLQPRKMLPFPWDAKPQKKEAPQLTREQRRDRFYNLLENL